jgi:hypothetical protein
MDEQFPDVAIEALRRLFPHPRAKQAEMKCLRATLGRLVQGEVDGSPKTPQEAIAYLREKLAEAAQALTCREKRFTPHLTTWLNGRRYLTPTLPPPANLEDAISILACYPTITEVDIDAHMPILRVIDEHCRYLETTHGSAAASYIRTRTLRFAECVARWPSTDLQFIVSPLRFFKERRYEQRDDLWVRHATANNFQSERDQLSRLLQ